MNGLFGLRPYQKIVERLFAIYGANRINNHESDKRNLLNGIHYNADVKNWKLRYYRLFGSEPWL